MSSRMVVDWIAMVATRIEPRASTIVTESHASPCCLSHGFQEHHHDSFRPNVPILRHLSTTNATAICDTVFLRQAISYSVGRDMRSGTTILERLLNGLPTG